MAMQTPGVEPTVQGPLTAPRTGRVKARAAAMEVKRMVMDLRVSWRAELREQVEVVLYTAEPPGYHGHWEMSVVARSGRVPLLLGIPGLLRGGISIRSWVKRALEKSEICLW